MGFRPGKTKGPWVGVTGITAEDFNAGTSMDVYDLSDGSITISADHGFTFDNRFLQSFWASKDVLSSGDWTLNVGNGLDGAAMAAASQSFYKGVRNEFDMLIRVSMFNTVNPVGFMAAGNAQIASMQLEYDGGTLTYRVRTQFTGQADVLTTVDSSFRFLRIRRNEQNQIRFFIRKTSFDPWIQTAFYACDMRDNVTLSLISSTGNRVIELAYSERPVIGPRVFTLTDAATIAVDASRANAFQVTLGGNRMLGNPTNDQGDGQLILFRVYQDGGGSRVLTYDTKYRFSASLPSPTLSTGAGDLDYLGFIYNKTDDKWDYIAEILGF